MIGQSVSKRPSSIYSLDILKIVLAVIVVFRHCGQALFAQGTLFNIVVTNTISPLAVPTFFAVSGYLFFRKNRDKTDLVKYVLRIVKLYAVWTLIYIPLIVKGLLGKGVPGIIGFVQRTIFEGSYYHLWYLPSLIAAICLIYVLAKKLNNTSLIIMSFALYIIGTLVESYSFLSPLLQWNAYKTVFLTTRNGIFFGLFFIVVGKIIAEGKRIPVSAAVAGIVVLIVEGWYLSVRHNAGIVNMSFASVLLVPMLLFACTRMNVSIRKETGNALRAMSTIIFCVHPWIISIMKIVNNRLNLGAPITTAVITVLVVAIAYGVVRCAERIKLLKMLF